MNKKELSNLTKEYNKTYLGKKVYFYSNFPFIILILLGIYTIILLATSKEVNLEIAIAMLSFIICFCTYTISQILYTKMFQEYLKNQK